MSDCTVCNVCLDRGKLEHSKEVKKISSNVRKFQTEKFTVWRCPYCFSIHSKEDVALREYYKYYPLKQHKLDMWARAAYKNRIRRLVRNGMKKWHSILDYGCGKGLFVSFLREEGFTKTVGYDPYVPEFADETVLDRSYDIIVAQDVIEHDKDPGELMIRLARMLGPEGRLCIGTPDAERIDLLDAEKSALSLHQPYHRHILSKRALTGMGRNIGLTALSTYHRWYYDTVYPTINYRFLQTYIQKAGNVLDVAVEAPRIWLVLTSPLLLFYALFGYLFPLKTEMMVFFHRSQSGSSS
jgi:2-polyprenyl-3-methyl-5-hydroxy-6-metoxy-1,4-benzoquinol methylase